MSDARPPEPPDLKQHLAAAATHARELLAYLGQYVSAKVGSTTLTLKRLALLAVLLVVLALIGLTVLITMCVMLVIGLAGAISALMPSGFAWVGPLAIGLIGALGVPLIVWFVIRSISSAGKHTARHAYGERLRRQRESFAVDAADRAEAERHRREEQP